MYGITFDLDDHHLVDVLEIPREDAYRAVEDALRGIGYYRVQHGVYVCRKPRVNDMLVVPDTIQTLKAIPWFAESVDQITAFEVGAWGNLLLAFGGAETPEG